MSAARSASHAFAACLAALALVIPAVLTAQTALPPASEIIARHVAAIGGRQVVTAKQSVRTRGTFDLPAMGVRGNFDAARSRSGSMVMRMELPGIGHLASGFDGRFAWSDNPMVGPRLLQGAELAQIRDDASFLAALREPPAVRALETVGTSEVAGERCYRVRVSWASGRTTFDCYSVQSGLLIGSEMAQLSPTGALDMSVTFSDYRSFDGVLMATTATQRAAGQEQVLRFTSVEFDAAPAELFRPPPAVATLIERQRTASQPR